uniref:Uncharacterized protein n=1 Tax=Romanomermis culicivorax TaxID=13658 RepID=A0A915K026_ROMCU
MQIDELDDQRRRHLHRSGAPQKDENDSDLSLSEIIIFSINIVLASNKSLPSQIIGLIVWSKGPKAQVPRLLTASPGRPYKGSW